MESAIAALNHKHAFPEPAQEAARTGRFTRAALPGVGGSRGELDCTPYVCLHLDIYGEWTHAPLSSLFLVEKVRVGKSTEWPRPLFGAGTLLARWVASHHQAVRSQACEGRNPKSQFSEFWEREWSERGVQGERGWNGDLEGAP